MKSIMTFTAMLLALAQAQEQTYQEVYYPTKSSDLDNWRAMPDIPYAWLSGTLRYALFEGPDGQRYITVQGETDNNKGASITDDNIDRVARGFFWQDASFGFDSMDGFVVMYIQETQKWYTKSLQLLFNQYDLTSTSADLTHYPSSWKWNCEVEKLQVSELVTCTREVPNVADFMTGEIVYVPQIVVNNIGYVWQGSELDRGSFEFGGQVTLNSAVSSLALAAVAVTSLFGIITI